MIPLCWIEKLNTLCVGWKLFWRRKREYKWKHVNL